MGQDSLALLKIAKDIYDLEGNIRTDLPRMNDAKKVRVLSEWGNHGLESSFPRLHDKFRYEESGERKIQMRCLVYLYNFRASTVGFNQIKTVFMPH